MLQIYPSQLLYSKQKKCISGYFICLRCCCPALKLVKQKPYLFISLNFMYEINIGNSKKKSWSWIGIIK